MCHLQGSSSNSFWRISITFYIKKWKKTGTSKTCKPSLIFSEFSFSSRVIPYFTNIKKIKHSQILQELVQKHDFPLFYQILLSIQIIHLSIHYIPYVNTLHQFPIYNHTFHNHHHEISLKLFYNKSNSILLFTTSIFNTLSNFNKLTRILNKWFSNSCISTLPHFFKEFPLFYLYDFTYTTTYFS